MKHTNYDAGRYRQIVCQMALRMRTEGIPTKAEASRRYGVGTNLVGLLIDRARGLNQQWLLSHIASPCPEWKVERSIAA